ncbi:hypothetical protein P153DRAFT_286593 [Dothidotthia symphoricarpi CBS 119687]|uniref:Luciferase domain-containing protein n=1 Tax=Dothidotthia symphoricarpi CBS 119687 TaxID=1392245 RepID=A0A6A6AMQ3_9PLEO|nr:uncharacterized protein P153DRAFT_286593 [Dothidotthia symphoricarpi CBS 119687]KAF2131761.1 hypothetical protein P153DRAFT_286593 [Dothidotthia symphoricarpi CBS 119687]
MRFRPVDLVSNFSEAHLHIFTTILTLVLPILTAFYIYNDYLAFLSLGKGGTPSTPLGYLKIKTLSLVSLRDPYRPLPIPPHFRPQKGYLRSLPRRVTRRPLVQGIAPQRQQTQKSSEKLYAQLVARLQSLARDPRNMLMERTSCFEKHSSGLFATLPITRTCGGEVCHAHPSDGSLHLTLHPADAKLVLEHGLGERHPLAKGGWYRRFVPREFVLIYAPRSEEEVDVVMRIVAAAVWWVSGVDVNAGDGEGEGRRRSADVAAIGKAMEGSGCGVCKVHACGGTPAEKMTGDA